MTKSPIKQLSTQVPVSYPARVIATAPHPGTIMRPHVPTTAAAPAPAAKQLAVRSIKFEDISNDSKPVNPYQDIVAELPYTKSQPVVTQVPAISQTTRYGRQIYPNSKYGYSVKTQKHIQLT